MFNNKQYKRYLNLNILYYIENLKYKANNLYIAIRYNIELATINIYACLIK